MSRSTVAGAIMLQRDHRDSVPLLMRAMMGSSVDHDDATSAGVARKFGKGIASDGSMDGRQCTGRV